MDKTKVSSLVFLVIILFSCNKKNETNVMDFENILENDFIQEFSRQNINKVEMIYSIEYYKNEITKYESNYYGFDNLVMEITQLMNISQIMEINNFVPKYLTFLVSWFNQKGYIFYLYTFNENQNIVEHYYCGDMFPFKNDKILLDKINGNKFDYGNISVNDFNNDGINEIALFSQHKNIGYVFIVYGFDLLENKLDELLFVPVFINFDKPFPLVEYVENGFNVLEVVDEEYMEMQWNKYIWNNNLRKYIKE
jgi:hypothetical protein